MSYPHRIRLRGPWEYEPLASVSGGPLPPCGRMTMPARWSQGGLADFAGRVRFRRRFGFPARIDTFERVWLTFEGVEKAADVRLNGQALGRHEGAGPFQFEVTSLLQVRNDLIVEVEGPAERGGLWGEVALEVRCSAFLQGVELRGEVQGDTARLHVSGLVAGSADGPLELYVLLDEKTIAYTMVTADQPFQITSDELEPDRWQTGNSPHRVRVDLVNVATIWYQSEQFFAFAGQERGGTGD